MKKLILVVAMFGCSSTRLHSFEEATRDQSYCAESETKWVEQSSPGNWVAMCGDDNGNPLHQARR